MADNTKRNTNIHTTYLYGATAPQYTPDYEPLDTFEEALQERRRQAREEERRRALRRQRRLLEREKRASRMNMMAMCFATVMILGLCATYIGLQSRLTANKNQVAHLKEKVLNLTQENDAREKGIVTSVDLNDIRKKAIKNLGMVYPKERQIKYYHIDKTDYMEQYKDIPTGNGKSIFGLLFSN
ncbi:hypothetical protein SAMN02910358_00353 [Lachnospiraceae bacterium XBB1006]|nr:hypothetical protein SAMN02910358_00353 [Lachnospiraceae bacterium XBB1006]